MQEKRTWYGDALPVPSVILKAMKITTLLLTVFCLQLSAGSLAQVTFSGKDVTLQQVFKAIERQTDFHVFYDAYDLRDARKVTVTLRDVSVETVLDKCLVNQLLGYNISGKSIFISRKKEEKVNNAFENFLLAEKITFTGTLRNTKGEAIPNATIIVKNKKQVALSDDAGNFTLENIDANSTLVISCVNYQDIEFKIGRQTAATITLEFADNKLSEVHVLSNGFQDVPQERATGSFVKINNELLNRRVSTNVLDRLDGIASGLIFNKNKSGNTPDISIRGRSTIFANAEPLIVLDNFPYTGDPANINPNDIESVTILKDAAAASIWGAYSGNGVIVITTKTGKADQKPTLSANMNLTISEKPDLFYTPQLTSSEYIDVERFLFDKGYYDDALQSTPELAQSPIIDILERKRKNLITEEQAAKEIDQYRSRDIRNNQLDHFIRNEVRQQYAMNLSGGSKIQKYYLSAGYDRNANQDVANKYDRLTINANNSYSLLNSKLQVMVGIQLTSTKENNSVSNYTPKFPYEQVVDANGNALPVINEFRQGYIDTVGQGLLLDWNYYPYKERFLSSSKRILDYRLNTAFAYQVLRSLTLSIRYQYSRGQTELTSDQNDALFRVRDMINKFSQIDYQTGQIVRPVPLGNIYSRSNTNYSSHNLRGQVEFNHYFHNDHQISSIAGVEVRSQDMTANTITLYGYDPDIAYSSLVDHFTEFPRLPYGYDGRIPDGISTSGTWDRFVSSYANVAYNYDRRFTVSGSVRKDESNLFGVKANQRGVPLWSVGASWELSKEKFYNISWIPYIRLRATYGHNGNIDRSVSAYTTARAETNNSYGVVYNSIVNPPNPSLTWEKVKMTNLGVDIQILKNVIACSVEYFFKQGVNLIGNSPIAQQTGLSQFRGNVANVKTNGLDVSITSRNINGPVMWSTNFLLSYVKDEVSKYLVKQSSNSSYISTNFLNPLEGKPYSAIFSYKWNGLDTAGNPTGFLDGKPSSDYTQIRNSKDINQLVYHGSGVPTTFGSLRNSIGWKNLDFSFNIVYKFGYYFRRPSISYSGLLNGSYRFADYDKRWQQPGDELITSVPSFVYPVNGNRDQFYANSEILVEKGDHIRFQDISISYSIPEGTLKRLFCKSIRVYGYVNNLGILWRANDKGIDPDVIYGIQPTRTYSIGIDVKF